MTKVLRLGEIAEVGNGNSAPQNEALFKGGTLPFVRTSDVGAIHIGSITSSRDLLTTEGAKKLKLFPAGTILFPKSGASTFLNHRVILNSSAYVSSHLATIKAISEVALDRYIFYFLQVVDARDLCQDQAYPSLNRDQIAGIDVPLPSLIKQETIVKKLDKAFAEIDSLEKNFKLKEEKTNQLLQSMLSAAFTNTEQFDAKVVKLGEVAKVISGQSPEGIFYNKEGKGVPFYQGKKEFGSRYIKEPVVWTTKITKTAKAEDILMSVRAPVGPINLAPQKICIGRGLAAIRVGQEISNEYLFYFLEFMQPTISGTSGAVFDSINKEQISSIQIPLPSIVEQKQIVGKLDIAFAEIEKLKNQISIEKEQISFLRQSILSNAFSFEVEAA